LRQAIVRPGRERLRGVAEVDETYGGEVESGGATGRLICGKALIVVFYSQLAHASPVKVKGKCSEIVADQIRPVRPIGKETGHAYPGDAAACVGSCAKCIATAERAGRDWTSGRKDTGMKLTAAYK
jgi:hypothetical protein